MGELKVLPDKLLNSLPNLSCAFFRKCKGELKTWSGITYNRTLLHTSLLPMLYYLSAFSEWMQQYWFHSHGHTLSCFSCRSRPSDKGREGAVIQILRWGGGDFSIIYFLALWASVWSKNGGGGGGLSWICHRVCSNPHDNENIFVLTLQDVQPLEVSPSLTYHIGLKTQLFPWDSNKQWPVWIVILLMILRIKDESQW